MPKRGVIKFKKYHKKCVSGISAIKIQNCPDTPITEIVLIEPIRVTVKHTNAVRKSVRRLVKKQGRLNRLLLNFWPITSKPAQIRMGKGKGSISYWAGRMVSGSVVASFMRIKVKISNKVLRVGATKVPGRTKIYNNLILVCGRNDFV